MEAVNRLFEQSTDAVFGIDLTGTVRFANSTLARLLGRPAGEIAGMPCADLLCGTDLHGKDFCGRDCPIPKSAEGTPPVGDFDLVVKRADGEPLMVNIGACYTTREQRNQPGQVSVFFSLRRLQPQRLLQRLSRPPLPTGRNSQPRLTPREQEILALAAQGLRTAQIAGRLWISPQTVRSHFKNIHAKLDVHSRSEAVVYALRHELV